MQTVLPWVENYTRTLGVGFRKDLYGYFVTDEFQEDGSFTFHILKFDDLSALEKSVPVSFTVPPLVSAVYIVNFE